MNSAFTSTFLTPAMLAVTAAPAPAPATATAPQNTVMYADYAVQQNDPPVWVQAFTTRQAAATNVFLNPNSPEAIHHFRVLTGQNPEPVEILESWIGMKENTPEQKKFIADASMKACNYRDYEVWCATALVRVHDEVGLPSSGDPAAISFVKDHGRYARGTPEYNKMKQVRAEYERDFKNVSKDKIDENIARGDILFTGKSDPDAGGSGHIAYVGEVIRNEQGRITHLRMIGGNQGNMIKYTDKPVQTDRNGNIISIDGNKDFALIKRKADLPVPSFDDRVMSQSRLTAAEQQQVADIRDKAQEYAETRGVPVEVAAQLYLVANRDPAPDDTRDPYARMDALADNISSTYQALAQNAPQQNAPQSKIMGAPVVGAGKSNSKFVTPDAKADAAWLYAVKMGGDACGAGKLADKIRVNENTGEVYIVAKNKAEEQKVLKEAEALKTDFAKFALVSSRLAEDCVEIGTVRYGGIKPPTTVAENKPAAPRMGG